MSQYRLPEFNENEQTPAQRWAVLAWAFAAGASDGARPSTEFARLGKFYVAGDIDLAMLSAEMDRLYFGHEYPPLVLVEEPGRVFPFAAEIEAMQKELATLPPKVPYLELDLSIPIRL
ncbi:hypothetical protein [Solirubrum puertoriconensis]|uniref:Uncharacterized protein n=1 Tax=Solirubrum puertoriconensis TaxID=1751427 RepID=A0A9X0HNH0_SOLP1|nr:hypothetical protein [Solirubrum puertoriconensis]KUG09212.1 hypothetical protein ASU33_20840 [Solirubrum puertoriconensis]